MATTAMPELDAQYRVLREGAGFLERDRGTLTVGGSDAAEYLQGQLTNEVEALDAGAGCYAALLDRKGHLQADMRVLRRAAGEFLLDLEPAATMAALRHLQMYSVGREVEIEDASGRWKFISAIGPEAAAATGFENLSREHAQRVRDWDRVEVLGIATDLGVDLIVGADDLASLRERLLAAGLVEVSEAAAEILRVESGRPRFGSEISPELMPAEVGIVERAVDFDKGCYIGQEPVARLHYRGKPNRHLRGLRLSAPVKPGAPLRRDDRELGSVGTACISPALGPIALAVLRREAEPGDALRVGDEVTAEVVELPFGAGG